MKRIVRDFYGLNIVGVDIVEVAPAYDTNAEVSSGEVSEGPVTPC